MTPSGGPMLVATRWSHHPGKRQTPWLASAGRRHAQLIEHRAARVGTILIVDYRELHGVPSQRQRWDLIKGLYCESPAKGTPSQIHRS